MPKIIRRGLKAPAQCDVSLLARFSELARGAGLDKLTYKMAAAGVSSAPAHSTVAFEPLPVLAKPTYYSDCPCPARLLPHSTPEVCVGCECVSVCAKKVVRWKMCER